MDVHQEAHVQGEKYEAEWRLKCWRLHSRSLPTSQQRVWCLLKCRVRTADVCMSSRSRNHMWWRSWGDSKCSRDFCLIGSSSVKWKWSPSTFHRGCYATALKTSRRKVSCSVSSLSHNVSLCCLWPTGCSVHSLFPETDTSHIYRDQWHVETSACSRWLMAAVQPPWIYPVDKRLLQRSVWKT